MPRKQGVVQASAKAKLFLRNGALALPEARVVTNKKLLEKLRSKLRASEKGIGSKRSMILSFQRYLISLGADSTAVRNFCLETLASLDPLLGNKDRKPFFSFSTVENYARDLVLDGDYAPSSVFNYALEALNLGFKLNAIFAEACIEVRRQKFVKEIRAFARYHHPAKARHFTKSFLASLEGDFKALVSLLTLSGARFASFMEVLPDDVQYDYWGDEKYVRIFFSALKTSRSDAAVWIPCVCETDFLCPVHKFNAIKVFRRFRPCIFEQMLQVNKFGRHSARRSLAIMLYHSCGSGAPLCVPAINSHLLWAEKSKMFFHYAIPRGECQRTVPDTPKKLLDYLFGKTNFSALKKEVSKAAQASLGPAQGCSQEKMLAIEDW